MIKLLAKYGLMFVSFVLIQVLLLNHVQLGGYLIPYIYIVFILLLPVSTPGYLVISLAFFLGLIIDIFSNSPGVHSSATLFMAIFRAPLIKSISQKEENKNDFPGLKQNGIRWFLTYAAFMVVIHHLFLFYAEIFSFNDFLFTLLRSLLSSVFSLFIIVLSQFIIFRE
jgi:rod shape-determining protein MreD